jgi:hypothetical protein
VTVGPFASFSVGRYDHESLDALDGDHMSEAVANKAVHEWLQIGARGTFNL